jgi:cold shock CspA family protein
VDEAWLGDILDIEEVFEGSEGLRGRGAVFIERPTRPLVTATIKTIRSDRGFAFAAQDHGPDLFLPISEFADFDIESSTSATFARLTRGDRIHAECIPGHPNPVGIRIAACAAAVAQDETGR